MWTRCGGTACRWVLVFYDGGGKGSFGTKRGSTAVKRGSLETTPLAEGGTAQEWTAKGRQNFGGHYAAQRPCEAAGPPWHSPSPGASVVTGIVVVTVLVMQVPHKTGHFSRTTVTYKHTTGRGAR